MTHRLDNRSALVTGAASDDSAWITGDLLLVDGGGHTKRYPELARPRAGQGR
jgi:hypothetical protein